MDQSPRFDVDITIAAADGERHTYKMPVTMEALRRLNAAGVSPTEIVLKGADYDMPESEQIATVMIGVTEAGGEWTEEEVGNSMLKTGFLHFVLPLGLYIAAFATGGVQMKHKKKDDQARKKKKRGRGGKSSKTTSRSRSSNGASGRRNSGGSR